jgi:hypothetical protein
MLFRKWNFLNSILDESPVFSELSIKEKDILMEELISNYPQLFQRFYNDEEVGYEASWLTKLNY